MLSWAAMMASFFCKAKFRTEGNSVESLDVQSMDLGICPEFKKKGANPVLSDRAEFMANSIAGNFATQSFWFGLTHCLSICVIVLLALSVDPSD